MGEQQGTLATQEGPSAPGFRFRASDVTGSFTLDVEDVQPALPAGTVANALASRMSLPENLWALRDDRTASFLDDERPIGDQIKPDAKVTLTPKSHLGGK